MIALQIERSCRLGNNILQFAQALLFARQIGAKIISVGKLGVFLFNPKFKQHICPDGTIITRSEVFPPKTAVIKDTFFGATKFGGQKFSPDYNLIKQTFSDIRSVMGINPKNCGTSNDIYCHVRAGDIFLRPKPKFNYVQPPLAFYLKSIVDFLETEECEKIKVVYETKDNPVVDGLLSKEDFFGVPVVSQSSTLNEDVTEILKARFIAMSFGTFIPMLCAVSGNVKKCSVFREAYSEKTFWSAEKSTEEKYILSFFDTVVNYYVDDGSYIPVNGWEICHPDTEKSLEQKRMIVDFPIEKIKKVK